MPARFKTKRTNRTIDSVVANLDRLNGAKVEVGIFDKANAQKAALNAYGTSTIPARNFYAAHMKAKGGDMKNRQREGVRESLHGRSPSLDSIGQEGEKGLKQALDSFSTPPNAPSTIAQKGKNDPLNDTGEMRSAITYRITEGG